MNVRDNAARVTGALLCACATLLSTGVVTRAQTPVMPARASIELSTDTPRPYATVTARVRSTSMSVASADIVWLLDGDVALEGVGEDTLSFSVGGAGSTTVVRVIVRDADNRIAEDAVTLRPAQVTVVWEANTYVPPTYRGRALYTPGSTITLEAYAEFVDSNGERIPPDELVYTWSRRSGVLESVSGVGRSSVTVPGPKFYGNEIYTVEVATRDGTIRATAGAYVTSVDPLLVAYEHTPLYGTLYHRTLDRADVTAPGNTLSLSLEPFFMDITDPNDDRLSVSWRVNGTSVEPARTPSFITLDFETPEDTDVRVTATVDHLVHLLQTARRSWLVPLHATQQETPFGIF